MNLILPIFMLVVSLVMLVFALIGLAMRQKFQWVYVPIGLVGTAYGALEILRISSPASLPPQLFTFLTEHHSLLQKSVWLIFVIPVLQQMQQKKAGPPPLPGGPQPPPV